MAANRPLGSLGRREQSNIPTKTSSPLLKVVPNQFVKTKFKVASWKIPRVQ